MAVFFILFFFHPVYALSDCEKTRFLEDFEACVIDFLGVSKSTNSEKKNKFLLLAAERNSARLIPLLIQQAGAGIETRDTKDRTSFYWSGQTPLMWPAGSGSVDMVEKLISLGGDVNARTKYGRTALDYAETYKQTEVVQILKTTANSSKCDC